MKQNTRICVPVTGRDYSNMMEQYNRACATADVVEFRLDYLDPSEISTAPARLSESTSHDRVQKIFTYRPKEQGGSRDLTFEERLRFWSDNLSLFEQEQVLVDLEYDLCIELSSCGTDSPVKDWGSVICSYHDFQGVPDEISKIYEKLSSTPASIIKLALKADDLTDCITLFSLLDRANRENRGLIAILMGAPGMVTRILGPSRGSYLTFASLNRDLSTAPGQLTSTDLLNLYHIKDLTSRSMVTGLVGNPVAHSVSPHMHNAAFSELSLDAVYVPLEVRDAPAFLKRMVHPRTRELDWGLRGLSVTAPHKQSVMDGLDTIDDAAREMGAVNTIVIDKDRLHGTNTDVEAAIQPLRARLDLSTARVAVIGSGGAARALIWGLKREGCRIDIFARNAQKARSLADAQGVSAFSLAEAQFKGYDLVINCTPQGTRGHMETETPALASQLVGTGLVYDLVYNPMKTRFMREAEDAGCETIGGLPMLVAQAAEQFRLWTGKAAPVEVMYKAAADALYEQSL